MPVSDASGSIEGHSLAAIKTRVYRAKQRLRGLLQATIDMEARNG